VVPPVWVPGRCPFGPEGTWSRRAGWPPGGCHRFPPHPVVVGTSTSHPALPLPPTHPSRQGRPVASDTTRLLLAEAAVVVAVLGIVAAYLGVRAWHRRPDHTARRGQATGRRMWTVAELRARENANQLQYYPQSRPTRATPAASPPWPSEATGQPGPPHTGR